MMRIDPYAATKYSELEVQNQRGKEASQMSIQPLGTVPAKTESRGTAPAQAAPSAPSFQDQLARTAARAGTTPAEAAVGRTPARDELISALFSLKVERMRLGKEKKEESDAWEELMEYLDTWIKSLQDGSADIEEAARAYAAVKARMTDRPVEKKDPGDYLLEQLTERFCS